MLLVMPRERAGGAFLKGGRPEGLAHIARPSAGKAFDIGTGKFDPLSVPRMFARHPPRLSRGRMFKIKIAFDKIGRNSRGCEDGLAANELDDPHMNGAAGHGVAEDYPRHVRADAAPFHEDSNGDEQQNPIGIIDTGKHRGERTKSRRACPPAFAGSISVYFPYKLLYR
jgi:hypothetical protein